MRSSNRRLSMLVLMMMMMVRSALAFQRLPVSSPRYSTELHVWGGIRNPLVAGNSNKGPAALIRKENELLDIIQGLARRDEQNSAQTNLKVRQLIDDLEAAKGISKPACSKEIDGKWKLLFTSGDNTASPIQRSFVGNSAFSVYQLINLYDESQPAIVSNIVDFGEKLGELKVNALASTSGRPIPGFVPRRGDGKILGFINLFGISKTETPADPDARIDFKFDNAGFDFSFLPFQIPYPVPFRILGDEVKGWIEVTYLSPRLRISRGNKGTIFVLAK